MIWMRDRKSTNERKQTTHTHTHTFTKKEREKERKEKSKHRDINKTIRVKYSLLHVSKEIINVCVHIYYIKLYYTIQNKNNKRKR